MLEIDQWVAENPKTKQGRSNLPGQIESKRISVMDQPLSSQSLGASAGEWDHRREKTQHLGYWYKTII